MGIIAKDSGGGEFTPAPQGVHRAVCIDVVDMGLLEVTFNGETKTQHKVRVVWEIDEQTADGKPFFVQKRYTLSLHEKSGLRKELESWRGRAFTVDELKGFDLEKLIGVCCMVNVLHVTREGKTYANVNAVMPLAKGMAKLTPTAGYVRVQDRPKDGQGKTQPAEPPHEQPDDPFGSGPLMTDDDIPFAWLLPFLLPLAGAMTTLGGVIA